MSSRRLRSNKSRRITRRRFQVVTVTLVLAAILALGVYLGQLAAYSGMGVDPAHYRELRSSAPKTREEVLTLQRDFEQLQTRSDIDRGALGMLREEIARQKVLIADLEEGLRFYRELMAPEGLAQGLSVREPEIVQREGERRFEFKLVAQQEAHKHEVLRGDLYVELAGRENGEMVSYALAQLSDDIDEKVITLGFRYFQSIEGIMVLPGGFEPLSVNVVATSKTPKAAEVSEQFPWQVQEKFTHVGK